MSKSLGPYECQDEVPSTAWCGSRRDRTRARVRSLWIITGTFTALCVVVSRWPSSAVPSNSTWPSLRCCPSDLRLNQVPVKAEQPLPQPWMPLYAGRLWIGTGRVWGGRGHMKEVPGGEPLWCCFQLPTDPPARGGMCSIFDLVLYAGR